jgi:DNA-binding NtrC family response regulator
VQPLPTILLCDDDPVQRRLTETTLRRLGYEPLLAENGEEALTLMGQEEHTISAIVLDLVMPVLDGFGVLERMRERGISIPVIVQTGNGSIDTVVTAMRLGATDFVVKPVSNERLQVALRNTLKVSALEEEVKVMRASSKGTLSFRDLASSSPAMISAVRMGERAASSTIPVLLEGESGVGKEVFARAIQGGSDRRAKPFITVNCGALPFNLIESILFGHEKGAFTGAADKHAGKFVEASGGTIFLDEIGELPLEAQTRLLRTLQEGEVDPVGAKKPIKVDVRVISATNKDLLQLVKEGKFREDLYYRLAVFPITIPPLRQRKSDIQTLARRFLARFNAEEGKRISAISAEAMQWLISCDWPGNVRQLENTLFRAVVLCDGPELTLQDFPHASLEQTDMEGTLPALIGSPVMQSMQSAKSALQSQIEESIIGTRPNVSMLDKDGHVRKLEELEREAIRFALSHYSEHMSEVARRLGLGRSTLYRKLDELGLSEKKSSLAG